MKYFKTRTFGPQNLKLILQNQLENKFETIFNNMKYDGSSAAKEQYFEAIREYETQNYYMWVQMAIALFGEQPVQDYLKDKNDRKN